MKLATQQSQWFKCTHPKSVSSPLWQRRPVSSVDLTLKTARPSPVTREPTSDSWESLNGRQTARGRQSSSSASWYERTRSKWRRLHDAIKWETFISRRWELMENILDVRMEHFYILYVQLHYSYRDQKGCLVWTPRCKKRGRKIYMRNCKSSRAKK